MNLFQIPKQELKNAWKLKPLFPKYKGGTKSAKFKLDPPCLGLKQWPGMAFFRSWMVGTFWGRAAAAADSPSQVSLLPARHVSSRAMAKSYCLGLLWHVTSNFQPLFCKGAPFPILPYMAKRGVPFMKLTRRKGSKAELFRNSTQPQDFPMICP